MARNSKKEIETATGKLMYAGPSLFIFGLVKGNVYVNGIPANAPEALHFAFVPVAEYQTTIKDAEFKSACTDAVRSLGRTK